MKTEKKHTCCFIGHRKITVTKDINSGLRELIKTLIVNHHVNTFLFGSRSQFDNLCHEVVTELKDTYPHIKRIYVRAEFPYIDSKYQDYLLQSFEDTYYPYKMINAGKAAYVERNREMIDKSAVCVVYYDKSYVPCEKSKCRTKSGTKLAYDYAVRNCDKVINLLNLKNR